jgi:drug/metabolite transporter (DMT)-like permease
MSPPRTTGLLFALGAATFYGVNIVTARLAADVGVSGPSVVFYRVFLMLALVLVAVVASRASVAVPQAEWGVLGVLGLATAVIGTAYLSSVAFIPVTVAVVIFYTFPILIVLASPLVEGTRLDARTLAIAGAAFLGVACVVGPAFEGLDPRGIALAGLASLATTVQFFAAARARKTTLIAKVFWIHVLVLPVSGLAAWFATGFSGRDVLIAAAVPVGITIACYVVGFLMQLASLVRASAVAIGLAFCLEPVVAAVTSVAILGERLSVVQIGGGLVVLAAIVANVLADGRRIETVSAGDATR